jgi:hypothetical protein
MRDGEAPHPTHRATPVGLVIVSAAVPLIVSPT